LTTPREVRHAIVYVLQNWRKHLPSVRGFDPRSSARWFTGWRSSIGVPAGRAPVAAPVTWLARVCWRRHALIGFEEGPRPRLRRWEFGARGCRQSDSKRLPPAQGSYGNVAIIGSPVLRAMALPDFIFRGPPPSQWGRCRDRTRSTSRERLLSLRR
jgi:hypothetical protein